MCGDATDLEHEIRIVIPAIIGAPGITTKVSRNVWKPYQENIQ
jgi:hypothetical protein